MSERRKALAGFPAEDLLDVIELLEAERERYKADSKQLDKLEKFIASQRPRIQIYWSNIYMQGREFVIQCRDGEYRGFGLGKAVDELEEQDPQHPGYGVEDDEWMNAPTGKFKEQDHE